jgi:hypothetical protein
MPAVEKLPQACLSLFTRAQPRCDARRFLALRSCVDEPFRLAHRLRPGAEQLADDSIDGFVQVSRNVVHETDA